MADEYDLQQSLQEQSDEFLTQNRTFAWVADSNNGSYAGGSQIVIEVTVVNRIRLPFYVYLNKILYFC